MGPGLRRTTEEISLFPSRLFRQAALAKASEPTLLADDSLKGLTLCAGDNRPIALGQAKLGGEGVVFLARLQSAFHLDRAGPTHNMEFDHHHDVVWIIPDHPQLAAAGDAQRCRTARRFDCLSPSLTSYL